MGSEQAPVGPIAVGGVGGSGTRVVAEILQRLGIFMGADLNKAGDNLWFTLLMRRARWYREHVEDDPAEIHRALDVFDKAMTGALQPEPHELAMILRAAGDTAEDATSQQTTDAHWILERVARMIGSRDLVPPATAVWGWKEPNTHIYLDFLHAHFPQLRYVHVMRHGLDMALSVNQRQLERWGGLFGIERDQYGSVAAASLSYWIEANTRAISLGRSLLGSRFVLVNFDDLCGQPRQGVRGLLDQLDITPPDDLVNGLASVPSPPTSAGRYRSADLGVFSEEQFARVVELGFAIDRPA